jgi:hypothetical protein
MFVCFFPDSELDRIVWHKLGNYLVAPAAWQNYLQSQDAPDRAVDNLDFAKFQAIEDN